MDKKAKKIIKGLIAPFNRVSTKTDGIGPSYTLYYCTWCGMVLDYPRDANFNATSHKIEECTNPDCPYVQAKEYLYPK